jgi:endonuclease I
MDPGIETEECGFKRSFDRYEPDDSIKGDIARILAYMKTTYNLSTGISVQIIKEWNKIDPVSNEERKRDALIKKIQGNSNPYVLDPSKVNLLKDDNM